MSDPSKPSGDVVIVWLVILIGGSYAFSLLLRFVGF